MFGGRFTAVRHGDAGVAEALAADRGLRRAGVRPPQVQVAAGGVALAGGRWVRPVPAAQRRRRPVAAARVLEVVGEQVGRLDVVRAHRRLWGGGVRWVGPHLDDADDRLHLGAVGQGDAQGADEVHAGLGEGDAEVGVVAGRSQLGGQRLVPDGRDLVDAERRDRRGAHRPTVGQQGGGPVADTGVGVHAELVGSVEGAAHPVRMVLGGRVGHVADDARRPVLADLPPDVRSEVDPVGEVDELAEHVGHGLVDRPRLVLGEQAGGVLDDTVGQLVADDVVGGEAGAEDDSLLTGDPVPEGVVVRALRRAAVADRGPEGESVAVDAVPVEALVEEEVGRAEEDEGAVDLVVAGRRAGLGGGVGTAVAVLVLGRGDVADEALRARGRAGPSTAARHRSARRRGRRGARPPRRRRPATPGGWPAGHRRRARPGRRSSARAGTPSGRRRPAHARRRRRPWR